MTRYKENGRSFIRRFQSAEVGSIMTTTALVIPVLIGFAGLGIDTSNWFLERREVQNIADMGAISAVHSGETLDGAALTTDIQTFVTARGDFDAALDTITVNTPPASGDFAGVANHYETIVTRNVPLYFVSAFSEIMGETFTVQASARAVAGLTVLGQQCIVALDPTEPRAIEVSGTADATIGCGIAANSNASNAISVGGTSTITAEPAQAVGGIVELGSGLLVSQSPPRPFSDPVENPLADREAELTPDSSLNCDVTGGNGNSNGNGGGNSPFGISSSGLFPPDSEVNTREGGGGSDLFADPFVICGGLDVTGTNVNFRPGTYIIRNGDFTSGSNSSFNATNNSFVLTGDNPGDVGRVRFNSGTDAEITSPTTGTYRGIAFYQDVNNNLGTGSNQRSIFNGGADLEINGALYFPGTLVEFNGGASLDSSCLRLFSAAVTFTGNAIIGNDNSACVAAGVVGDDFDIDITRVDLLE